MARTKNTAKKSLSDKQKEKKHKRVLKALEKDGGGLPPSAGGIKKPHKWRPGTVARRECRKFQKNGADGTRFLVPKTSIERRIRDRVAEHSDDVRLQADALQAFQSSVEALMVDIFSKTGELTVMRKQKTISRENFRFCTKLYLKDYVADKNVPDKVRAARNAV